MAALNERIAERRAHVGVVGLGHVGLPLSLAAAEAGFSVTGVDIDSHRIDMLERAIVSFAPVHAEDLEAQLRSGRFRPTRTIEMLAEAEVIAICVPTPLKNGLPDMSFLEAAAEGVARLLQPGRLVILESTTYPGTTEGFLREILESSGLRAGEDFFLGFSPERIDPGNKRFRLSNVPKLVAGVDRLSTEVMAAFYECFIAQVIPVSSPKTAEMAKLLENTYRHVNIALVNEIAILCHDLGIDIWEVIEAASTKPFGFHPFFPGPGWGGHCIPVDPAYLSWRVRQMGQASRFIELSQEVNEEMPAYVVQRIGECLKEAGKSLEASSVLLLGTAYKADVADLRESPALGIISGLRREGACVSYHDPYVGEVPLETGALARSELSEQSLREADIVVVVTNHSTYDWAWVARHAPLVLDTRNALKGQTGRIVKL